MPIHLGHTEDSSIPFAISRSHKTHRILDKISKLNHEHDRLRTTPSLSATWQCFSKTQKGTSMEPRRCSRGLCEQPLEMPLLSPTWQLSSTRRGETLTMLRNSSGRRSQSTQQVRDYGQSHREPWSTAVICSLVDSILVD